jgi:hypothetical protein
MTAAKISPIKKQSRQYLSLSLTLNAPAIMPEIPAMRPLKYSNKAADKPIKLPPKNAE